MWSSKSFGGKERSEGEDVDREKLLIRQQRVNNDEALPRPRSLVVTLRRVFSGIVFGTLALVILASCDYGFVRDNPHDPESPNFEPGLTVSARHHKAEWVALEWDERPGTSGYTVERSWESEEFSVVAQLGALATSYADSTERSGTYRYRVTRETPSGRTVRVTTDPIRLGNWLDAGERPGRGGLEEFAAPLPGGRILIFRPRTNGEGAAEAVILDPATLTWTSVPAMPLSRVVSVVVLDDGRILALGGYSETYMYLWDRIGMTVFDPESSSWIELPEPPHPPADTYVPMAIQHMGGTSVLVAFQAVDWSNQHFTPRRYTYVLPVSYIFDLDTGEYREIGAPDVGGRGARATVTGMVRATADEIRAFGSIDCADGTWETCERTNCAWSFDVRSETWTRRCSSASIGAPNLLPLNDYRYLSLADNMTFHVRDGLSTIYTTLAYGSSLPYFMMEGGYVIGGNPILVVDRTPFRVRRFSGPIMYYRGSTTVLLPDGRLLTTTTSSSRVWVSRPLEQMPEES